MASAKIIVSTIAIRVGDNSLRTTGQRPTIAVAIGARTYRDTSTSAMSPPNCSNAASSDSSAMAYAETSASKIHPTRSLAAAAAIATTPTGCRSIPNCTRIRPRIGKAVIANATATNSA